MNPGRNATLRRVLALWRRVEGMRYPSVKALAVEFKVHHRTIRRDLEVLEDIGCRVPRWRDEYTPRWTGRTRGAVATPPRDTDARPIAEKGI